MITKQIKLRLENGKGQKIEVNISRRNCGGRTDAAPKGSEIPIPLVKNIFQRGLSPKTRPKRMSSYEYIFLYCFFPFFNFSSQFINLSDR